MSTLKNEFGKLFVILKGLDKKTVIVLSAVPLILTFSWYYTSRLFFQQHFATYFSGNNTDLFKFGYWFAGDFFSLFLLPWLIISIAFNQPR